jgi:hypothetical protein
LPAGKTTLCQKVRLDETRIISGERRKQTPGGVRESSGNLPVKS